MLREADRGDRWEATGGGGEGLGFNGTAGSVLLHRNERSTEVAALQQLRKLAPLALFAGDKVRGIEGVGSQS